ncbi:hypothetical protein WOLCODRAFT_132985 [Wolfiporia cocos MD-104 SS10]|uniref:Mediator complex subunit 27 n=1 Tax=Wolfiporia cocos (strain MD-104) TaxID=742152 RepID=A0A2H3K5Y2_WOLCO|nr:hypothetical protein WOLCODRAFT_132985 [Wolfiporia cocos MD-104 SS10]
MAVENGVQKTFFAQGGVVELDAPSTLPQLQSRIQTLKDLQARLQTLRRIPAQLLRPPANLDATLTFLSPPDALRHEVHELKQLKELVCSKPVQDALVAARDSAQRDKLSAPAPRRENRKRKRAPSPESPPVYVPVQPKSTTPFPPLYDTAPPTRLSELQEYVREYNRAHSDVQLRLLSRQLECPLAARLLIPDVAVIYLVLNVNPDNRESLIVENITAFGPREQKPPHSQSEFLVYQRLSQQLAKTLQAAPTAPLAAVLDLLAAYRDLFLTRCCACQRILSAEGHVPPVARVWTDAGTGAADGSAPRAAAASPVWEPWHPACLQR